MSTNEAEPEPAHAEAEPARSTPQLSLLLELQEADLGLDRLAYRRRELAERVAVSELDIEARRADRPRWRGSRPARQACRAAADPRPAFRSGRWRIATIEQRLRSGGAGSYRDEQAMGEEVASLTHLRREIEDQELEVMEALEPLDQELAALRASSSLAAEELALAREQLGMATAAIDDEAAVVGAARDRLASACRPRACGVLRAPQGKARRCRCSTRRGGRLQRMPLAAAGGGVAQAAPRHAGLGRLLRPVWSDTRADERPSPWLAATLFLVGHGQSEAMPQRCSAEEPSRP